MAVMFHNLKERLFFGSSPNDSGACIFPRKSNGYPLRDVSFSYFTNFLYTVGNELLEKYTSVLGHVNHCRIMFLVAFSLVSRCAGWTFGCFLLLTNNIISSWKTSSDVYASQVLHNIYGAYGFYTYWYHSVAFFSSLCLCKMNILFLSIQRPHVS